MKTEETGFTVYEENSIVQCPDCLRHLSKKDFTPVIPDWSLTSDGGRFFKPTYYTCCNKNKAIVFDVGDGSPMRLVAGKVVSAPKE